MTFSFVPFQGVASEYEASVLGNPTNTREGEVLPVLASALTDTVHAIGGYLSVDVRGQINPAVGETGDTVNVLITSLPLPAGVTLNPVEPTPAPEAAQAQTPVDATPVPDAPDQTQTPVAPVEETHYEPVVPEVPQTPIEPVQPVAPVVDPVLPETPVAPAPVTQEPVLVAA